MAALIADRCSPASQAGARARAGIAVKITFASGLLPPTVSHGRASVPYIRREHLRGWIGFKALSKEEDPRSTDHGVQLGSLEVPIHLAASAINRDGLLVALDQFQRLSAPRALEKSVKVTKRLYEGSEFVSGEIGPVVVVDVSVDRPLLHLAPLENLCPDAIQLLKFGECLAVVPRLRRCLSRLQQRLVLLHRRGKPVVQCPSAIRPIAYLGP